MASNVKTDNLLEPIFSKLRRTTSSNFFIPEIDGLRFLAISLVVFLHITLFVLDKTTFTLNYSSFDNWLIYILKNGSRGVNLFFVISGFILALPFAKHFLSTGPKISLKKFYLKRLTRLEPPYIIATLLCFVLLILKGKYTFTELIAPLGTSLVYLHNIFPFGPYVNGVAWSLEIEVQFYLLVPLLALIFKLDKRVRRFVNLLIIILFPILNHFYPSSILSLYVYLHYFFIGFLLADLYVSENKVKINKLLSSLIGLSALATIVYINFTQSLIKQFTFLFVIFVFYYLVLNDDLWRRIFSNKILTSIGGMCYSIYLIHVIFISGIGNISVHWQASNNFIPTLLLQILIILPFIFLGSTIFFLLIEKPCMDKDWPKKLYHFLKSNKIDKSQIISPKD